MSSSYSTIGFIGLGTMGYPMAGNLIKKLPSVTLYVFDVVENVVNQFAAANKGRVHACKNSKEVAEQSDIILTMVPEGSHVKSVFLTPKTGILAAEIGSKVLIDCSTIDTSTSLFVRDEIARRFPEASFYDAPVSGGSLGAAKGTLTFMVGCSENDQQFMFLADLLSKMGTSIFGCGGPCLGLTTKLCNNYCSGLIAIATSEAFNIGMRSGMDPRVLANIFKTTTAQSCISDKWNPVPGICPEAPASKGYEGGFKVQLMKKDFGLAVEAAEKVGARLCLGEAGLRTYGEASEDERCMDLDSRVVFRYLGGNEDWEKEMKAGK